MNSKQYVFRVAALQHAAILVIYICSLLVAFFLFSCFKVVRSQIAALSKYLVKKQFMKNNEMLSEYIWLKLK